MFADRFSTIREFQPHISPQPPDWINHVDNNIRERIDEASLTCIDLDRYLRLAYDQDDAQLIDIGDDEDDYQIEEYKKPKREVVDAELDALSYTISGLLAYGPASRGTPETLLRSPWFRRNGVEDLDRTPT
jgi:serine/threonine-protein kinase SRPK3